MIETYETNKWELSLEMEIISNSIISQLYTTNTYAIFEQIYNIMLIVLKMYQVIASTYPNVISDSYYSLIFKVKLYCHLGNGLPLLFAC